MVDSVRGHWHTVNKWDIRRAKREPEKRARRNCSFKSREGQKETIIKKIYIKDSKPGFKNEHLRNETNRTGASLQAGWKFPGESGDQQRPGLPAVDSEA